MPEGEVKISVRLETAMGIMNAYEIVTGSGRIVSAIFGAVDYCADMRIRMTNRASEKQVARAIVAVAVRAAGIVALDAALPTTPTWTPSSRTPTTAARWATRAGC